MRVQGTLRVPTHAIQLSHPRLSFYQAVVIRRKEIAKWKLSNELLEKTQAVGGWEPMNGSLEEEIFQWYIIDERGADILKEWTNELLLYNDELNLWLWGVDHWGTAWDYVLTNIRIEPEDEYGY